MSAGGKKWHYLAVKSFPRLLSALISNHVGGFFCLNYFHSCNTKNRLKKHVM